MIDIRQIGKYKVYDNDGNFISSHSTSRIAMETVINNGGGYYEFPDKVQVDISIQPSSVDLTKVESEWDQ